MKSLLLLLFFIELALCGKNQKDRKRVEQIIIEKTGKITHLLD